MAGNSFGDLFRITTFGESHGPLMGVVVDGCPSGIKIDTGFVQEQLNRRRPGQSKITTQRKEHDTVEIVSGVFNGVSTGTPIAAFVKNEDARSTDYKHLEENYRPSHADYTYDVKFGIRDHRGGGRASARETVARVIAGSIAKLLLKNYKIEINAYVSSVGSIHLSKSYESLDLKKTDSNIVRCPDNGTASKMISLIEEVKTKGDTVGGIISCVIQGVPAGLGEPVFDKLHSDLGKAMLSINAVKGFEYGSGFSGCEMRGSEHNDIFKLKKGKIVTETNFSGGIQGGISNGMDIYFRVAFKPVATILKPQVSINCKGKPVTLEGRGRHDPCVVPRAVPVVESMAALVLADHILKMNSLKS